ncbi:MAG: hypothetical protein PVG39_15015 [Desulfobacteraceae bacterium]|jgi:hypothetical protein
MDFWTFITVIVIIIVSGDVVKKVSKSLLVSKFRNIHKKEIDDLKSRVNELEKYPGQDIEKRLQAIESIVVDPEHELKMKFKKLLEEK